MSSKEVVRERVSNIRKSLTKEEIDNRSKQIISRLNGLEEFIEAINIHCYVSKNSEVDTQELFGLKGKNFFIPYVEDENIKYSRFDGFENLKKNAYGILEPVNPISEETELDIIIIPGIAFDKKCNRIGYGKGYYDRFLAKHGKTFKIGLAFECQIVDEISVEEYDVPVDVVVTENDVLR